MSRASGSVPSPSVEEVRRAALRVLLSGHVPAPVRPVLEAMQGDLPPTVWTAYADAAIVRLDNLIAAQLDAVLHAPPFQRIEASWRGVAELVAQTPFHENIQVILWSCTKEELANDLAQGAEFTRTAIYLHAYTTEYGTFGGAPFATIMADMEFGTSPTDLQMLKTLAAIASSAHAPFFAAALPSVFGLREWPDLADVRDLGAVFEGPGYTAWNEFRDAPDSRYIGLLLPRILLRTGYRATSTQGYTERVGTARRDVLWGNPVYVLAARFARIFARDRALTAIVGDDGDAVRAFASESFDTLGPSYVKPAVEVTILPRIEQMLRDVGFIALLQRKQTAHLFIASANSLQKPRRFGISAKSREAAVSYLLGTQLPYLLLASRFAHYIKVLERDTLGGHRSAEEIEQNLDDWLGRYVVNMDSISPSMRARYPLRGAKVKVLPDASIAGGFRAEVMLRPHLRYLDAFATLTVSSSIDPHE